MQMKGKVASIAACAAPQSLYICFISRHVQMTVPDLPTDACSLSLLEIESCIAEMYPRCESCA